MAKKPPKKSTKLKLIDALKFLALAQRPSLNQVFTFCQLVGGFATSSDGILTAGHKIDEDLEARPHTKKFIAALMNCGARLSITQLENNQLAIRSGKYFARVPCHDDEIPQMIPDMPQLAITDEIRVGMTKIAQLAQEGAATVYQSSILIRNGSMVSANGYAALEYWHGINLPTMVVPKIFATAVCATKKKLTQAGFSESSLTFWFDDDSWLKTQLFGEEWPDVDNAFTLSSDIAITKVNSKFFTAVRAVEDFAEEGREKGFVYLGEHGVSSHKNHSEGAVFNIKGLPKMCFSIKQLKSVEKHCSQIGFDEKQVYVFGEKVRGVVMASTEGDL